MPPQQPVSKGLAVASMVTGIVGLLLGWVPILGLLIGIAAIILGILALRKRQSKPMSWVGIVAGALSALGSILVTIAGVIAFDEIYNIQTSPTPLYTISPVENTPETSPTPTISDSPSPTPTSESPETTTEETFEEPTSKYPTPEE